MARKVCGTVVAKLRGFSRSGSRPPRPKFERPRFESIPEC
jgi:hypothetical protein